MNELEARKYATQFAARWPDRLQVQVDEPTHRDDGSGYVVRLTMPREHRVLRLTRDSQIRGIHSICSVLLGAPLKKKRKAMIEQKAHQEIEEALDPAQPGPVVFSEEEAATYLGVKINTIRVYASNGALARQENGGYLLEDLRKYRDERDTKWGRPKKPLPGNITSVSSDPPGEAQLLQALIAHAFSAIHGITGLGRLSEMPRTWKVDVTTERGPESYRITRNVDGSFQQERW